MRAIAAVVSIVCTTVLACACGGARPQGVTEPAACADGANVVVAAARLWFDAFNRHEADAIEAFYATDAVAEDPPFEAPKVGPAAIAKTYRDLFVTVPNIKDNVTSIVGHGNKAFIEFTSTGTVSGVSPGEPPEMIGKAFTLRIFSVLEWKDGRIVHDTTYYDRSSFLKQMGLQ